MSTSASTAVPAKARRPELDGLRGLAILIVVLDHGAVRALAGAGGVGVTIFFVLSGFLITGLLLREHDATGRIDLRAFYLRRARRLLPALVVFLAATVAFYGAIAVPSAVVTILYIANIPAAGSHSALFFPLHHMWSLAVEEQFYLVWPAVMLFLVLRYGRGRRQQAALVLGMVAFSLVVRAVGYPMLGYDWTYRSTLSNLLPLLAGAAMAAWVRCSGWRAGGLLGVLGVVILASATFAPVAAGEDWMVVRTLVTVLGATMLLTRSDAWMRFTPLRYCGKVSYGWYLWHVLFQVELGGIEGAVVSFGVAVLSYHLWESRWIRGAGSGFPSPIRSARAIRFSAVG